MDGADGEGICGQDDQCAILLRVGNCNRSEKKKDGKQGFHAQDKLFFLGHMETRKSIALGFESGAFHGVGKVLKIGLSWKLPQSLICGSHRQKTLIISLLSE